MAGFELQISGVGSNRSANCATTAAQFIFYFLDTIAVKWQ